ncbi:uncharacterized protein LOC123264040 [Cotesia glomerata]|uniref:uncharacterized protein LOC123264040 n=1 Tax=Cotesia glomerata TaxID=32391 RepID=UPI001D00283F|nr:uncharacterized protein LOC123264040 [Cotesia glomerata]
MYRQVRVNTEDTPYQKILYRRNTSEPIQIYTLETTTYGTSSASYLAIKILYKLADDEEENFPIAAQILCRDFYVDDVLTGAQTISEAIILRDQLISLLKKGGFCLRKWAANHPSLLIEDQEHPDSAHMSLDPDSSIKILGIRWNSREDYFFYVVNLSVSKSITKRTVLSQIAKLFDPLDLLGPIIVHAKIIMQLLWKAGVAWDEPIPVEIHSSWSAYLDQLSLIENLRFPRGITIPDSVKVQLHGFCDSSEKAYGACLYLRSVNCQGQVYIRLISSKSRVAPVKPLTLPRLELCAAILLARLYHIVKPTILTNIHESYLWSDSTIVLHWINTPAHRLKTFVSNRVSEIQTITESCHWRHVLSQDNPADLIFREQLPSDFIESSIWIDGPSWLTQESSAWPKGVLTPIDIPDLKPLIPKIACLKIEIKEYNIIERFSSFSRMQRVIACILRFIHNVKKPSSERKFGPLLSTELAISHDLIIRLVQSSCFKKEIESIKAGESLPSCSKLIPLNPIINEDDILRVGGRLAHSSIAEEQCHPILLPAQHHVTKLIIKAEHFRLKHAGMQATLYSKRLIGTIPPRAPHFGGIWEVAVKSFKHHLIRTVGDTLLTFEQLETYIIEIEAILNLRPISPMSSDPNDLLPLTPSHFLIGSPLTAFSQVDFTDTPINCLSAWQHTQQLKQHFWIRWHKEYLHQLIKFSGSPCKSVNIKVGTLVLIFEENLPPLQWVLGRITAVHPGKDGIVRVVTLRTKTGTYDRCVKKLCPLPIDEEDDDFTESA